MRDLKRKVDTTSGGGNFDSFPFSRALSAPVKKNNFLQIVKHDFLG